MTDVMAMRFLYITILSIVVLLVPIHMYGQHSTLTIGSQSIQTHKMRSVAPMRANRVVIDRNVDVTNNTYGIYSTSMELYTKSKVRRVAQPVVLDGSSAGGQSLWVSSSNVGAISQIGGSEVSSASVMYGLVGPGVPDVPEGEVIPLDLEWDVIVLLLMMALGYSGIVCKRSIRIHNN